jgi:hypothetical protein
MVGVSMIERIWSLHSWLTSENGICFQIFYGCSTKIGELDGASSPHGIPWGYSSPAHDAVYVCDVVQRYSADRRRNVVASREALDVGDMGGRDHNPF